MARGSDVQLQSVRPVELGPGYAWHRVSSIRQGLDFLKHSDSDVLANPTAPSKDAGADTALLL